MSSFLIRPGDTGINTYMYHQQGNRRPDRRTNLELRPYHLVHGHICVSLRTSSTTETNRLLLLESNMYKEYEHIQWQPSELKRPLPTFFLVYAPAWFVHIGDHSVYDTTDTVTNKSSI